MIFRLRNCVLLYVICRKRKIPKNKYHFYTLMNHSFFAYSAGLTYFPVLGK